MSELTNKLSLFKYDTVADAKKTMNLDTCLNENWDKIDQFATDMDAIFNKNFSQVLDKKVFNDINTELGKKLEAEALLAENGYIKFNNGIILNYINFMFPAVSTNKNTDISLTFPKAYTSSHTAVIHEFWASYWNACKMGLYTQNLTSFVIRLFSWADIPAHSVTCIAIGF